MAIKVAINGFGRIGRMVLRALVESERKDIRVVAINDLGSINDNAHMLKYDSVHGRFPGAVSTTGDSLNVGSDPIKVLAEPNPEKLPWGSLGADIILECSGHFTERAAAAKHLTAGAKRVLVSAPATGADITVVYGVNHQNITSEHTVISNGSCTTNCLAPVADVLHTGIGIEAGYMTTIHSYTGDQRLVDTLHKDLRRARAAAMAMIPTSTGAAKALGLVLPALQGKLDGCAIRVPTPNVSLIDFTFTTQRATTVEEINSLIENAVKGKLKGILDAVSEPLVSVDFNHHPASSVFDTTQTQVISGRFCRVLSWYDNEWGFANRMGDVAIVIGKTL
ncbi:MAG: type I glyceraldehyde-3-phosphate dehydrogenase [Alphaproteobacteria bacterium]|nr:type I glyceraldehyde-3-phosphate dehydrogenase [Alphaproteobacteria bacterium]